jgi:DNA-binding NtrC family response regulator
MADDHPIDVVLLDYRLPDSNDLGLLEEVRRRLPGSTVVLMTAYGSPDLAEDARRLGVYSVVTKPFDLHGLESLLKTAHQTARPH